MFEEKSVGALLKDLGKVNESNAAKAFTPLFRRGYTLLNLSGNGMARVLDTSEATVRRWKSGEVVPPAANLVLRFLREEIEKQVAKGLRKGSKPTKLRVVPPPKPKQPRPVAAKPSVSLGRANPNYPTTCTTFWKQMEPALHSVMEEALKKTKVTGSQKSDYKGITRRIYRAAVISATTFLQKKTQPSSHFLQEQGNKAVNKAVSKLFNGKEDIDSESGYSSED
jgi:hypothetical protein